MTVARARGKAVIITRKIGTAATSSLFSAIVSTSGVGDHLKR
jgi:hypothetical protein